MQGQITILTLLPIKTIANRLLSENPILRIMILRSKMAIPFSKITPPFKIMLPCFKIMPLISRTKMPLFNKITYLIYKMQHNSITITPLV